MTFDTSIDIEAYHLEMVREAWIRCAAMYHRRSSNGRSGFRVDPAFEPRYRKGGLLSGAANLNVRKTRARGVDDAARVLNPAQRAEDVINQGKGRSATDPYVDVYRALGDPTRMRIMSMIARNDGEYPCTRLEAVLDITKSTISYHVKILSSTGLVKVRKDGRYYHYLVQRSVLDYFAPGLWERLRSFDD